MKTWLWIAGLLALSVSCKTRDYNASESKDVVWDVRQWTGAHYRLVLKDENVQFLEMQDPTANFSIVFSVPSKFFLSELENIQKDGNYFRYKYLKMDGDTLSYAEQRYKDFKKYRDLYFESLPSELKAKSQGSDAVAEKQLGKDAFLDQLDLEMGKLQQEVKKANARRNELNHYSEAAKQIAIALKGKDQFYRYQVWPKYDRVLDAALLITWKIGSLNHEWKRPRSLPLPYLLRFLAVKTSLKAWQVEELKECKKVVNVTVDSNFKPVYYQSGGRHHLVIDVMGSGWTAIYSCSYQAIADEPLRYIQILNASGIDLSFEP